MCADLKPATHLAILYADRGDRRKSPGVPGAAIAILADQIRLDRRIKWSLRLDSFRKISSSHEGTRVPRSAYKIASCVTGLRVTSLAQRGNTSAVDNKKPRSWANGDFQNRRVCRQTRLFTVSNFPWDFRDSYASIELPPLVCKGERNLGRVSKLLGGGGGGG